MQKKIHLILLNVSVQWLNQSSFFLFIFFSCPTILICLNQFDSIHRFEFMFLLLLFLDATIFFFNLFFFSPCSFSSNNFSQQIQSTKIYNAYHSLRVYVFFFLYVFFSHIQESILSFSFCLNLITVLFCFFFHIPFCYLYAHFVLNYFIDFCCESGLILRSHCVWYWGIEVYIICGWAALLFGIPGTAAPAVVWTPHTFGWTMRYAAANLN